MSLIHGQDSNGNLLPLLLDSSGQVILYSPSQVQTIAGSVTKPLSYNNDPLFSYDKVVLGSIFNGSLAAGTNYLISGGVPANKLWVITNVSCRYIGSVANVTLLFLLFDQSLTYTFTSQHPPVSNQYYPYLVQWYLQPTWQIELEIDGATAGDSAQVLWTGYQMALT